MRSCFAPPQTIAPRRPLPSGRASTHCVAGRRYQSRSAEASAASTSTVADPAVPRPAGLASANDTPLPPIAASAAVAFSSSRRLSPMLASALLHHERLAVVADAGVGPGFDCTRVGTRAIDEAHVDLAAGLHPGVRAFARADGELAAALVPRQRDAAELAALVAVVAAGVLVQRERAVGAGVDVDGQRRGRLLVHVLLDHGARHNRAGTHEQRHACQRRGSLDGLAAIKALAGLEIDPVAAGR